MARPFSCIQKRVFEVQIGHVAGPTRPISISVSVVMVLSSLKLRLRLGMSTPGDTKVRPALAKALVGGEKDPSSTASSAE